MGSRVIKKYLLIAILCVALLGFIYQFQTPACFIAKNGVTEYIGPEVSDTSLTREN